MLNNLILFVEKIKQLIFATEINKIRTKK